MSKIRRCLRERISLALFLVFCFFCACAEIRSAQPALQIKLGQSREIGRDKDTFGSIVSACEDARGNFYVLDRIEHRVLKFSSEGRPLLIFGQKGQGPGDFQSPGRIAFSSQGELVVLEDLYYVSFFTAEGVFLKRLDLTGRSPTSKTRSVTSGCLRSTSLSSGSARM